MRENIVVANWKMNKSFSEAMHTYKEVSAMLKNITIRNTKIIIASPYPYIYSLYDLDSSILLAAQNCYTKDFGAYTGEVSAPMIKSIGASYIIVGHSERRMYFNETSEILKEKISIILSNGLKPIFCVGEPLDFRESGKHIDFVVEQLDSALASFNKDDIKNIIIAYEPIWAIGTNISASNWEAESMHNSIRCWLISKYGKEVAESIPILYGGSVSQDNAKDFASQPNIDGALVGGASLNAGNFVEICQCFNK